MWNVELNSSSFRIPHSSFRFVELPLVFEHGVLGGLDVTEHALVDCPKKEAEEPQAGQKIVHDRGDGEDAIDIAAIEQDELAELVGEAEHAGDQDQEREADGRQHLRPRGRAALVDGGIHYFWSFPFSARPWIGEGW